MSHSDDIIDLRAFYAYGHREREMIAARAPFRCEEADLVGRHARVDGVLYEIVGIGRQIAGPISAGEPVGFAVRRLNDGA